MLWASKFLISENLHHSWLFGSITDEFSVDHLHGNHGGSAILPSTIKPFSF